MNKHQLPKNCYCILSPEDCKKWFKIADSQGLVNSGAFNLNDEDMLYVDKDGLIYSCREANYLNPANKPKQTLSKIPAEEFLLRLQGKWEQPNEVTLQLAINFPLWMQQNRWYNFQNGKWRYTFEQGMAMSKETYEKRYTKTPNELFELYQLDVNNGWKP